MSVDQTTDNHHTRKEVYLPPLDQLPDHTVGKCTFRYDKRGTYANVAKCKDLDES